MKRFLKKATIQAIFSESSDKQWSARRLDELLRFQNGINANREAFGSGVKLISVSEILDSTPITYYSIRTSVEVDDKTIEKFSVSYGDVLFQRSSETVEDAGKSNIYMDKDRQAVFGGFVIRGKKIADYNPIFLNEALKTPAVRKQMMMYAQGAQHINIGQESLSKVVVNLPPLKEQDRYAEIISSFDKRIALLEKKIIAQKELKRALLQQMFV